LGLRGRPGPSSPAIRTQRLVEELQDSWVQLPRHDESQGPGKIVPDIWPEAGLCGRREDADWTAGTGHAVTLVFFTAAEGLACTNDTRRRERETERGRGERREQGGKESREGEMRRERKEGREGEMR